jgi:hypothetical protein
MNLSYSSNDEIVINTKGRNIILGNQVRIGEFVVPGAGEYDIASIQCEVNELTHGQVYFIYAEDLVITYLDELNQEITKLDDAAGTVILILDLRSDDDLNQIKPILKTLEPSYLFLRGAGATEELKKALNLPVHPTSVLKVQKTSLPLEGTFLVSA